MHNFFLFLLFRYNIRFSFLDFLIILICLFFLFCVIWAHCNYNITLFSRFFFNNLSKIIFSLLKKADYTKPTSVTTIQMSSLFSTPTTVQSYITSTIEPPEINIGPPPIENPTSKASVNEINDEDFPPSYNTLK